MPIGPELEHFKEDDNHGSKSAWAGVQLCLTTSGYKWRLGSSRLTHDLLRTHGILVLRKALGKALSKKDGPDDEGADSAKATLAPAVKLVPRPGVPRSKVQLTPPSQPEAAPALPRTREPREPNQSTIRLQERRPANASMGRRVHVVRRRQASEESPEESGLEDLPEELEESQEAASGDPMDFDLEEPSRHEMEIDSEDLGSPVDPDPVRRHQPGVLRLLPALKATVVALTVMVIGEFIATYYQEAISELLTPLLGLIALRDASQTGQCILCLALVAGFNCISDITSLVLILSGERYIAGARYFFSTECSGKVRVYDPTTQSMKVEVRELCSWQTVLGNSVLICALILEFLCCKWSIKAFRAYQADNFNAMDAMLADGERMDGMDRMGPTAAGEGGEDRPRPPAASQGFVPFSGQGQRLS
eukprot:s2625_g3.t1